MNDLEFLKRCGVDPDSGNAELALKRRSSFYRRSRFFPLYLWSDAWIIDVIHKELMQNPPLSCPSVKEFFTQDDIKHAREEFARERRSGGPS